VFDWIICIVCVICMCCVNVCGLYRVLSFVWDAGCWMWDVMGCDVGVGCGIWGGCWLMPARFAFYKSPELGLNLSRS